MDQKDLLTQALGLIYDQRRRRWWLRAVTGMAAAVIFVTTYLLILPAITMEHGTIQVAVPRTEAALGAPIVAEITAEAANDRQETIFVLEADGDNAGLDETALDFDGGGVAVLEDEDGEEIELHRDYQGDGSVCVWFSLGRGQASRFRLPWVNGVDRFRTEVVAVEVIPPETPPGPDQPPLTEEPPLPQLPGEPGGEDTPEGEETPPSGSHDMPDQGDGGQPPDDGEEAPDTDRPEEQPPEDPVPPEEEAEELTEDEGDPEPPQEDAGPAQPGEPDESAGSAGGPPADAAGEGEAIRTAAPKVVFLSGRNAWGVGRSAQPPQYSAAAAVLTDPAAAETEDAGTEGDNGEPEEEQEGTADTETPEPEIVYYTELVLESRGDPGEAGWLTLSFGSGTTLEEALRRAGESLELSWAEEEPALEIPPYATSWAVVEKEGFPGGAAYRIPSDEPGEAAGLAEGRSYDFAEDINSVTVSKQENGQWVPGTEFTEGDSVRVEIEYTIPADTVGADNQTIHYQLPEGIRPSQEESGIVYDGLTQVGTYVIGTDGRITITFEDDFSDDKPFNGRITFQGTLSAEGGEGGGEIDFGGDGNTITVKPGASPTDIHVEKEGSYHEEDGKLHYTVTVSTEKGTEGTVTISDSFGTGNTSPAYDADSFRIVKVKADGTQETVTGYAPEFGTAWTGGPAAFTIKDLPKLEAGEQYIVTYTAAPGETSDAGGASSVYNNATGTSGGDKNDSGVTVTISQQVIQKSGYYDSNTGKIKWTIRLNPDKRDIGGYVLTDTMTIGGETVSIPAGTVITMTGSGGGSQTITLPYTFPEGSSDSYTITYETDPPQGEPGESWTVSNKAELEDGDDHYEAGGNVTGQTQDYNVGKSFDGLDQNASTDTVGTYKWVSRITVPKTDVELAELTYTDTLTGAVLDGEEVADSHYITAALLGQLTATVNGTTLERGTDYEIRDAQGGLITDFTDGTHLTGFQVRFLDPAREKVTGQTIELRYQTQVDYTALTGDGTYTIVNQGSIPGHDSESSTTYEPPKKLEKQASITGEGGSSYTGESITIDYEASGGIIHYRLLLKTDASTQGDITLTDLLPKGAALVEDSVTMRFYENDWHEPDTDYDGYVPSEHIHATVGGPNPDGTTPVTFTIDEGYNKTGIHTLVVYYDLSIQDDPRWTDDPGLGSHLYRNQVTWGSESAGTDVTVEREVPDLKKTGEQLPQYDADGNPVLGTDGEPLLSNTIRYAIVINAGAKDLAPELEFITLWDKLDASGAAGAEFLPASVKLYHYDPAQENSCGREIDPSLYAYIYDETAHVLTFNLPDETACVLVCEYVIDRGSAAGDLQIKNEAHLTGGSSSGGSGDVTLKDTSSSAIASKKVLTLYKVDATNYGKLLPGAVFRLEIYDTEQKGWETLRNDLATDENGQFTLVRDDNEQFENFNFRDNTLYRLTEIQPPDGYGAIDVEPYHFVWVKDDMTADAVKQEMIGSGALGGVASESVHFLTTSGALYIPNQPTELTVKKIWQDESGMAIPPGADSVELTLYQQAVDSNAKTVTVTSTGHQSWSQTHTSIVNVAEDSGLTIQITGVYIDSLDIRVGDGEKISVPTGSGQVWTYTIDCISEDTTVHISPTDQNEGNSFGNISFSGYTMPYYTPVGEETVYETVTLNAGNNWSYTWRDLPKQDNSGKTVYYHVREVSPVPGFEVIYSTNNSDGVQAGDLTVINRSTGYVLPETGGTGELLFTAGGPALMALAGLMYLILRRKGRETP